MGMGTYTSKKKSASSYLASVNTSNKWSDELDSIYTQIANREKFNYDQNNDALYKQYAQQYQQNAKLAMDDTVGQVSSLTGGYANSYAATAGQAMYNQQMGNLNEKALELYQLALQQYNMESDRLMGIYNMTATNYGFDQDRINSEIAQAQWNAEFDENQRQYDESMAYEYARAAAQDAQWKAEFNEMQRQYNESLKYDYARAAAQDAQWAADLAAENSRYYAGLSAENSRYYAGLAYDKQRAKASDEQYASDLAYKYAALEADKAYNDAKLTEDKRQFDLSLAEDQRQFNEKQKKSTYSGSKTKVMSKTEYERTVSALPNDLRQYLTYGAVQTTNSDEVRKRRVTALKTSVDQNSISEDTAEKLLVYWGYY
jgi:hypothetical protein